MLKYLASAASYLLLSFLFVGIAAAEESPERLFADIVHSIDTLRLESESYSQAFASYKNLQAKVEQITTQHSTADITLQLHAGTRTISNFTLAEFNNLYILLGKLATAERDPFFAAYLATDKLQQDDLLLPYLLYSSNKHTAAGNHTKALSDLNLAYAISERTDAVNELGSESLAGLVLRHKDLADAYISSQTYDISLTSRLRTLLSPKNVENKEDTQHSNEPEKNIKRPPLTFLSNIIKSAKQNTSGRAASRVLQRASKQNSDHDAMYQALMGVAYLHFESGLSPTADDEAVLLSIVQRLKPVDTFWEELE